MTEGPRALRIAIVGAESTGKTTLAEELAAALSAVSGRSAAEPSGARPRVALVGEVLREWCEAAGRTPRREEQREILLEQHRRIDAAAATHQIVISDTTGLMTHVYSELLFDDRSLRPLAVERHRGMTATLLTALDLPWVADGHQRDGEHVREPVDDRLRELLLRSGLPFSVVSGVGPARLTQALAALQPLLAPGPDLAPDRQRAGIGIFTALFDGATRGPGSPRGWTCECCVPAAERALRRRRAAQGPGGRRGPGGPGGPVTASA